METTRKTKLDFLNWMSKIASITVVDTFLISPELKTAYLWLDGFEHRRIHERNLALEDAKTWQMLNL